MRRLLPLCLLLTISAACGTDPSLRAQREEDTGTDTSGGTDTATGDVVEDSGDTTPEGSGSGDTGLTDTTPEGSGSGDTGLTDTTADGSGSGDTTADTAPGDTTADTDPADTAPGDTTADTDPGDTTADTDPGDTTADTDPGDTTIPPGCGDGLLQSGELCDDGNSVTGDGCNSSCQVELGYVCTGLPSRCTARCEGVICSGGDACNVSACNPSNGRCELSPRADGTVCDDGDLCTTTDVCQAGVCGGRDVVCPAGDGCSTASCNPANGLCEATALPDCTACGSGNFCAGGVCGGVSAGLSEPFSLASAAARFTMSGTLPWTLDTTGGRSGGALRAGAIGGSQSSTASLSVTLTSTATLTFWYRVSSEANYDYLRVALDGVNIVTASGVVSWTQVTRSLSTGTHTLVFTYSKDATGNANADTAWIDDLSVSAGVGGNCPSDGCGTQLFNGSSCVVCGALPNGTSCPGGGDCTEAVCDAGRCTEVSIPDGTTCGTGGTTCTPTICAAGSCVAEAAPDCTACGTDSLCGGGVCRGPNEFTEYGFESDADLTAFVMGGSVGWSRTTTTAYAGSYALRSGAIASSTTSTATLTVTTAAATDLRFWVSTSTESCCDRLSLTINGVADATTWGGVTSWTEVTRTLPAGTNTLVFTYRKDASLVVGSDAVWIDNLRVGGAGTDCGASNGCGTPFWNGTSCITCNPEPEGTICEADATDCVIGTCRSGACAPGRAADGTVCDGDASDCRVGTCRTGLCNVVNATNGTVCDSDTSDCLVGSCNTGSCVPAPVANGTSCDTDSTDCTRDTCQSGACNPAPLADCTNCGAAGDGLCGAGICQGGGGTVNGFETAADLTGFDVTPGYAWTIDRSTRHGGAASLRSPAASGSFYSTVTQTVDLTETTTLSFWYKVSNASGYDYLYFYLDGNYYGYWTGEIPWTEYTVSLPPGSHTFQFYYYQSGSSSAGANAAWIDDVTRLSSSSCPSDACGRWVSGASGCQLCETTAADCTACGTDSACMAGRCGGVAGEVFSQNFTGSTRPAGFSADTYPWFVDTTGGRTGGAYASAVVPTYGSSTSSFSFTTAGDGMLTFWYKLNGYSGYDYLYVYLDGSTAVSTSTPSTTWTKAEIPVSAGTHTVQLYFYNGLYSNGTDRAWVDDIRVTAMGSCASDACGLGLYDGTACNVCPLLPDGASCDADTTDCDSATCSSGVCGTAQLPDCSTCGVTGADRCIAGACGGLPTIPVINFDSTTALNDFTVSGSVSRNTTIGLVKDGTGSLRIGPMANYGTASAAITVEPPTDGTITFWRRAGLASGDTMAVLIDGSFAWQRYGSQALWEFVTLPLSAGVHEITFYVSASFASAPVPTDRSGYFDTVTLSAYPTCPASNTCVYSGYDGAACAACDTGVCGP